MSSTTFTTIRKWVLASAEAMDAHRVVPRAILMAYGWMVWKVTQWYMSIPSTARVQCQNDVMTTLFNKGVAVDQVRAIACSITDTVGGPTSEQTMFVSIIVGLSSVVIGLYLNSGNQSKWQGNVVGSLQYQYPPSLGGEGGEAGGYGYGSGRHGGYNRTFTPDMEGPEEQEQPVRGSWMSRMRGKKAADTPSAPSEEAPDMGEDSYQG